MRSAPFVVATAFALVAHIMQTAESSPTGSGSVSGEDLLRLRRQDIERRIGTVANYLCSNYYTLTCMTLRYYQTEVAKKKERLKRNQDVYVRFY